MRTVLQKKVKFRCIEKEEIRFVFASDLEIIYYYVIMFI